MHFPSLLGLPRELRLQIYDHVLDQDLEYTPIERFRGGFALPEGFYTIAHYDEDSKLSLPWLNLLSTCKTIVAELCSHMDSESVNARTRRHTYVMSLEPKKRSLGRLEWNRILCPPSEARELIVNLGSLDSVQFWGDGGPNDIVRQLYQTLNWFLHCGPSMDVNNPLAEHMVLKRLALNLTAEAVVQEVDSNNSEDHDPFDSFQRSANRVKNFVASLEGTGLLWGYVGEVIVRDSRPDGEPVFRAVVAQKEKAGVPEYWTRYGFQWGNEALEIARERASEGKKPTYITGSAASA